MTKNVHQEVWRLIAQDFSVQKDLKRGLVNVRALAKYLIKKHQLTASLDAVISAIRRYDISAAYTEVRDELDVVLKDIGVFTRDHMAAVKVNSHRLPKMFVGKGFTELQSNYRIIKSKKYALILFNEDELEKVVSFFTKEDIVEIKKDLAELRIVFPPKGQEMRGILSRMLNEIAMREVSVSEFIVCYPDVLIYVNRKKLLEAHHAVLALHDEAQKSV